MKINDKGFWENPTKEGHAHDSRLAGAILKIIKARKIDTLVDFGCGTGEYARFFRRHRLVVEAYDGNPYTEQLTGGIGHVKARKIDTLVDFGCGTGEYARFFRRHGLVVEAYDGNPYTEQLTGGIGHVKDLSQRFNLLKQFGCVMSLEVGEHIPTEFEQAFFDNLITHSTGEDGSLIILSWAVPGQVGDGHVNCRSNDYIMQQMQERGFYLDNTLTNQLRKAASLWWFKNSLMVFI